MAEQDPEELRLTSEEKDKVASPESRKKNVTKDSVKPKSARKAKAAQNTHSEAKRKPFRALLGLIILASVAVAVWFGYQQVGLQIAQRDADLQASSREINDLAANLAAVQSDQQNTRQSFANYINDQQRQMQALSDRLRATEGARSGDWQLAEAQYLLRLADQRLLIARDTDSAIKLLEGADQILVELSMPELAAARQALISDIAALRAIPTIDRQGIYFGITALEQRIALLSLADLESFRLSREDGGSAATAEPAGFWSSLSRSIRGVLSPLFVVRKTDTAAQWMIDAESEGILRAKINLLLNQSMSALLAGEQEVYQAALSRAVEIIRENFESSEARDSLLEDLSSYASRTIRSEVPDISASLRALEQGTQTLRRLNQGG